MKHANDPGTIEMFDAPKRRGRPPQGKQAMTPAERAKRYRDRKQSNWWAILDRLDEANLSDILATLSYAGREDMPATAYACALEIARRFPKPKGLKKS